MYSTAPGPSFEVPSPPVAGPSSGSRKQTQPPRKRKASVAAEKSTAKKKQKDPPPEAQFEAMEAEGGPGYIYNLGDLFLAPQNSRRDTAALAWEALIPSLVYPLMAQLAKSSSLSPLYPNRAIPSSAIAECLSGCNMSSSRVHVISFGGKSLYQKS
jgi:hypothetical protein